MARWIKNEFWNGYNWFERAFMAAMILLQVIMYCIAPDTVIGMACGISGVICVVLTAKGKISSYLFNFIQMITYMVICWDAKLFLEFGEQIFYFVACICGVFLWKKNMQTNEDGTTQVIAKKFKPWHWVVTITATVATTLLLGTFGNVILGGKLPYLDAFTVALAVIAQLLMVWRYREQWAVWIVIDFASLVMFVILADWAMVAMYIAWTINAFYGWYNWTKLNNHNAETNKEVKTNEV
jgi:nicotinamide mononucleotide transporter